MCQPDAYTRQFAKLCANWVIQEVLPRLKKEGKTFAECPVSPQQLGELVARQIGPRPEKEFR
jgi:Asp-tRNA(Asn)/Glu-tRNA(Gln) amidotransferase B subunit